MKHSDENISFNYKKPSKSLEDFVHLYWEHINFSDKTSTLSIFPDSFFKIIIGQKDGKVISFFMTGLWKTEMEIKIPAGTTLYGIKFKILAPEYILQQSIASILQSYQNLQLDFWDLQNIDLNNFDKYIKQIELLLIERLCLNKKIKKNKLQLSQLLYLVEGNILAEEVSKQINWSNRQINRYLNKYLGVSLKTYLNIQKCYSSLFQIREGIFHPDDGYFDQSHFIREVKKHTGKTPKELYKKQKDRFIQLSLIRKK